MITEITIKITRKEDIINLRKTITNLPKVVLDIVYIVVKNNMKWYSNEISIQEDLAMEKEIRAIIDEYKAMQTPAFKITFSPSP